MPALYILSIVCVPSDIGENGNGKRFGSIQNLSTRESPTALLPVKTRSPVIGHKGWIDFERTKVHIVPYVSLVQ